MHALRRLSLNHGRMLLALVALVLLARGVVPAGWMPVGDAAGTRLALCDGAGAMPAAVRAMAQTMVGGHHRGNAPREHHQGAPEHPCAFAGAVAAIALPDIVAPTPPSPMPVDHQVVRLAAMPGRGLAAPPPPPTGPPAFA